MTTAKEEPEFDWERIGRRVRERRLRHGMTTAQVAAEAGVTRQTIVRLESGKACKMETLQRVRSVLRLFYDFLMRPDAPFDFVATHDPATARWTTSRPKSEYQKHGPIADSRHENDSKERLRLGRLGYQPFFTCLLDSELPGGILNQGVMEIYRETWVDQHPGEEFVYCLRGRARLHVRGEEFVLEEGAGITFNAMEPHQYAPAAPIGTEDAPVLLLIVLALRHKIPVLTESVSVRSSAGKPRPRKSHSLPDS